MKKILCILLLAFSFCMSYGQNKQGALKFLDIPIDGSETQMILKLKRKGFSYDSRNDLLQGQFNGQEVNLYIHTNHNVVDRIYVAFPSRTAQDVKDEYNRLLSQLRDNPKYKVLDIITPIPQEEDLYYEMNVEGRLYETAVYYFDEKRDQEQFIEDWLKVLIDKNSFDEANRIIKMFESSSDVSAEERMERIVNGFNNPDSEDGKRLDATIKMMEAQKEVADGCVWFKIHQFEDSFYIGLYYDNLHNRPHGEDL